MPTYKEIELRKLEEEKRLLNDRETFLFSGSLKDNLNKFIIALQKDRVSEKQGYNLCDFLRIIYTFYTSSKATILEKEKVIELLKFIQKNKLLKLAESSLFINSIYEIINLSAYWKRDISILEINSYNVQKQFSDILHHLFADYKVPEFMLTAFELPIIVRGNRVPHSLELNNINSHLIDLFLHLGEGKSLKKFNKLPFKMTNSMINAFINAPSHLSIQQAFSFSRVFGISNDERLTYTIIESQLFNSPLLQGKDEEELVNSIITFFANLAMFDFNQIGPLIDYIIEQRRINKNYSIKGRTINSLLKGMEDWHEALHRIANINAKVKRKFGVSSNSIWTNSDINSFSEIRRENKSNQENHLIKELNSSIELGEEGKRLAHCVGSYVHSCVNKNCSIFSYRINGVSQVTIEVRKYEIVQVRGYRNALPTESEKSFIKKWAQKENLLYR